MDEISELEKYKDLLDSGAISEEEFTQLKQKLLGLKTDEEKEAERQAERAEALKEIDALREAQKQKEEAEQQGQVKTEQEEPGQPETEQLEKANPEPMQKEQVKLEPEHHEQEDQEPKTKEAPAEENTMVHPNTQQKQDDAPKAKPLQRTQSTTRTAGSVIKSFILWIVCIFIALLGIISLMTPANVFFTLTGIVCLILAVLACPPITSRTKDIPVLATFYQLKVPIVVVFVILAFVFMYLAGSNV